MAERLRKSLPKVNFFREKFVYIKKKYYFCSMNERTLKILLIIIVLGLVLFFILCALLPFFKLLIGMEIVEKILEQISQL